MQLVWCGSSWPAHRAEVADRLAPALGTAPTRWRVLAYLDGLLSGAERKNGWQLAEVNGDADPGPTQSRVQGRLGARSQGWRPMRSRSRPMDTNELRFC